MTSSSTISNSLTLANIEELPRPEACDPSVSPAAPARVLPNVADTGRIRFGAGYRLPLGK